MNTTKDTPDRSEGQDNDRRSFLRTLWVGLGIIALMEYIVVIFTYLSPRKPSIEDKTSGSIIHAGPADDFEKGSVTAFRRGKFYLVRLDDGGFMALSRKCTHLGCTVPWVASEKKFICPCHSSVFDIRGAVVQSPASRPLDIFAVSIENGNVKVDTTRKAKRSAFDKSQVAYI